MFFDLLTLVTARCSPDLRRLGYLEETIAMRNRHASRRAAWQAHLERSKQSVLAAAAACRSRNKLVILGSGLLLDVPLAELSSLFREVVLMDVICLPGTANEISRHPNARFVEYDVTGISAQLVRSRPSPADLPELPVPSSPEFREADLIVSLNLLSQVWVIPRAFILKQRIRPGQEQLDDWCGRLVEVHYRFLRSLPCAVCLIADHEFVKRDSTGGIISRGPTIYDVVLPQPDTSWTWNIAPLGTESGFFSKELVVGAWTFAKGISAEPLDKEQ
jgi:hypothetical protein